jgi:4-amino-4-deoxy-L-arabinose transferase-like glycosyltransferase
LNVYRPQILVLLLLLTAVYTVGLGSVSLWDVDETRNARAAEEMMISGDLVVPTVNGAVRAHKPPLHYWFMILAYKIFGVGEFSARIFQAVFAMATVILIVSAGSAVLGQTGGLYAGAVLGVSFLFTIAARSATTDTFLVFFTNAAVLAGYFASGRKIWAVVSWVAMGFAVLAKGPVGVVLPLGALILFKLTGSKGRRGFGSMLEIFPVIGVLLFIAIAAPWYILAAARTGGNLVTVFILKHNVGRFLNPMESHGGPFFYYLPVLLAGFYPWSVFLPQAAVKAWRTIRSGGHLSDFMRLQLIWASLVILFFSAASTKLANYILPSLPALALLTAAWMDSVVRDPRAGYGGRTVSWIFNLVPGLIFPAAFFVLFKLRAPDYLPLAWLAAPMAAAAVAGLVLHLAGTSPKTLFRCVAYLAAVGVLCIHALLLPRLEPLRMAPRLGKAIASDAAPGDQVAAYGYNRPALYFYGRQPVVRVKGNEELSSFIESEAGRFIVSPASDFDSLPDELRNRFRVLEKGFDALDTNEEVVVAERIDGRPEEAGGKAP